MPRLRYCSIYLEKAISEFTLYPQTFSSGLFVSSQIVSTLNHLVASNVAKVHEDAPLKFVELIQLMRVARVETIESLWAQFKSRPDHR